MKRHLRRISLIWMMTAMTAGLLFADARTLLAVQPDALALDNRSAEESGTGAKKTNLKFQKQGGIVYKQGNANGEDYELKLDVYVPEGKGPFPAILAIHGGSWTSGTKLHLLRHAWRMAARGYVVVAINYRHAPRHKFPCQIQDCKQAVRWIRHNASAYKIDPEKIGAYGYSAGGHLAALLGTTDKSDGLEGEVDKPFVNCGTRVQAVAIGGAPCEFDWAGSNTLAFWIGAKKDRHPERYAAAAPITYIDRDDPPFYVYHGERDFLVPMSSSEKMHAALCAANVQCSYHVIRHKGHFATFSDFEELDCVIDFFDETLQPESTMHNGAAGATNQ